MNDFAGFIIALVILIFLIYITVQFVIPFLMIWVLPSLVFYTALFFIIRKNKVVPGELDFYITDRGLKQIGIYSLLPLAVHSGALFLFDVSEYGETIVFMNFILILFGAALFFAHYFENRRRFYSENQYVNLIVDKYMGLLNSMLFLKNDIQILLSDNLIPGNEADSHIAEIDALIERVKQERVKIESLFREPSGGRRDVLNNLPGARARFLAMLDEFREYDRKFNLIRCNFQGVR